MVFRTCHTYNPSAMATVSSDGLNGTASVLVNSGSQIQTDQ